MIHQTFILAEIVYIDNTNQLYSLHCISSPSVSCTNDTSHSELKVLLKDLLEETVHQVKEYAGFCIARRELSAFRTWGKNSYGTLLFRSPHVVSSLAHHWLQLVQEDGGWGVVPGQLKQNLPTYGHIQLPKYKKNCDLETVFFFLIVAVISACGRTTYPDQFLRISSPLADDAGGWNVEEGRLTLRSHGLGQQRLTCTCVHMVTWSKEEHVGGKNSK